jgi:hypothetical protein
MDFQDQLGRWALASLSRLELQLAGDCHPVPTTAPLTQAVHLDLA